MCGIAGIARRRGDPVSQQALRCMVNALRHRGPDGSGIQVIGSVGLAHTRLSIIDPRGGAQPLSNEDGKVVITYNGEVFNHLELRDQLKDRGHRFRTQSDTEMLVHAYEEWGDHFVERLNGQFAFGLYDARRERLLLGRDRFGVRPLFYSVSDGNLYFASEAKALFATGDVHAAPDLTGLDQVFTFWGARAPRTVFEGVRQLAPGTFAVWQHGNLTETQYYAIDYAESREEPSSALPRLDELLRSSVEVRLRADVPVGGSLSGGLDSSITCVLASEAAAHPLRTFSVGFEDAAFDETTYQLMVVDQLHSDHATVRIAGHDVASVFPEVVRHTETPLVRTAPAPMYMLARLIRERGIKVVLSGEGADETFLGYDLFKETSVRRFCLRQPQSRLRPRLFDRLYPYLGHSRAGELWRRGFLEAGPLSDPLFSHLPRFLLTSRIKAFYSSDVTAALHGVDVMQDLRESLPRQFERWDPLNRAAYLEITTLLSSYLLSSQGDRMGMAHGVESRLPFLDHRLFEFAAGLPTSSKLRGLREKEILRRWARPVVPAPIRERNKQPYRAPDAPVFFGQNAPEYVEEMLSEESLRRTGIFDPVPTGALVRRARAGRVTAFGENQALVAILSTQLWCNTFFHSGRLPSYDDLGTSAPVLAAPH